MNAYHGDGTSGTFVSSPNTVAITDDAEIIVHMFMNDWSPGSDMALDAKDDGDGNLSYRFILLADGKLRFQWSEDGTYANIQTEDSDIAVSFANASFGTVRVIFIGDDTKGEYAVIFSESDDVGETWTNLGGTDDTFGDIFGETY
jgi:hypothetical protein